MTDISYLIPVKGDDPREAIRSLRDTNREYEFVLVTHPDTELEYVPERATVVEGPGKNVAAALNAGIEAARGEYIFRQDADDVSYKNRIKRQITMLESFDIVGTGATIVRDGKKLGDRYTLRKVERDHLEGGNRMIHGSVAYRKSTIEALGGYNETLYYTEDYDLWMRAVDDFRIGNVPDPLYELRLNTESVTAGSTKEMIQEAVDHFGGDRNDIPTDTAQRLLRYGNRAAAREELLTNFNLSPKHLALTALSATPQPVVDRVIGVMRSRKNDWVMEENA